jgi:hypothetical protein
MVPDLEPISCAISVIWNAGNAKLESREKSRHFGIALRENIGRGSRIRAGDLCSGVDSITNRRRNEHDLAKMVADPQAYSRPTRDRTLCLKYICLVKVREVQTFHRRVTYITAISGQFPVRDTNDCAQWMKEGDATVEKSASKHVPPHLSGTLGAQARRFIAILSK